MITKVDQELLFVDNVTHDISGYCDVGLLGSLNKYEKLLVCIISAYALPLPGFVAPYDLMKEIPSLHLLAVSPLIFADIASFL